MKKIEETIPRAGLSPIVRPLKEFAYRTANTGGSFDLGKLSVAKSYNWVSIGAANYDARFVEAFQYQGVGGARSHRSVTFRLGLQPSPISNPWVVPADPASREIFSHSEAFDSLGQRTSVVYPTCMSMVPDAHCSEGQPARTVASTYASGFLNTVANAGFNWVTSTSYHRSGLWSTMTRGNTVIETQTHDDLQIPRPKSIDAKLVAATLWKTGTMAYDRSGNLTRMQVNEEGGSDLYIYDKVSRLKQAQIHVPAALGNLIFSDGFESGASARWLETWPPAGWVAGSKTQNFTFDRFGNLTQVTTTGEATEIFPTSQATNRMLNSGTQTYHSTYDDRGNLTEFDGTINGFDSLNRQWKRESPDGSAQYYLYTADDERLMTTFSSGGVSFRWTLRDFGGKVLRVYENSGTGANAIAVRDYIHAGERILGSEDPRDPTNTRMLASVDHLGTPRLWTDSNGNPLRKHKYFPFGKEATPSDQWSIALQFTGHERDANDLSSSEEDSDYLHARFGGSATGRMMSVDPIPGTPLMPQTWNQFNYVAGNPLKFVDRTGLLLQALTAEAREDLCVLVGPDCDKLISFGTDGMVTVIADATAIAANEGLGLINDLASQEEKYGFTVGTELPIDGGAFKLGAGSGEKTAFNVTRAPDSRYIYGTPQPTPPTGFAGMTGVFGGAESSTSSADGLATHRASLGFHELAENFLRTEKLLQYAKAHPGALERERRFREQRPDLSRYALGGGDYARNKGGKP